MIACLAISSCVYYALELTHMVLDRERVGEELRAEVERLEAEVERLKLAVTTTSGTGRRDDGSLLHDDVSARATQRSWWKIW